MFGEVAALLERFGGGSAVDRQSAADAADEHVQAMAPAEVEDHVQTAAETARSNGQSDIAELLEGLLSGQTSEQDLKQGLIAVVTSNPQILEHFAPSFAQGILSRM